MREKRCPGIAGTELVQWFARRIPGGWFTGPPAVMADRDEILVVGSLPHHALADCAERIDRFRETTRHARMRIAAEAEAAFGRRVSWGAECGDTRKLFTTMSVPVMTRLRLPERAVLDTLVAAGVARSRSDALAWCVRLVGEHEEEWLGELREALAAVEMLRTRRARSRSDVPRSRPDSPRASRALR